MEYIVFFLEDGELFSFLKIEYAELQERERERSGFDFQNIKTDSRRMSHLSFYSSEIYIERIVLKVAGGLAKINH